VLRAPLLHFLVLGGILAGIRAEWAPPSVERPRIVFHAADVARLRAAWTAEHGTAPDAATETALVRDAIDDEVLYREALAAGFDRGDAAVRERLVRLGGFVGEESARDRATLEGEARRLGLERSDVVIRRHLVEMMRLALERPADGDLPSEAELEAYRVRHAAELSAPATTRLTHVYFSAEARGTDAARDAARTLGGLRAAGAGPDAAAGRGDPFLRGGEIGPASRAELEATFGSELARAVDDQPVGTWVGPLRSSYGLHLVWVRERQPARLPPLAAVRSQVLIGLLRERGAERAAERFRALRARYDVAVESG
jgi:peptidyl-prolyl cis-trans isomerase C